MNINFKKGGIYTRNSVYQICFSETRTGGGNWDTGYVRVKDHLIIFMNIGVPGATGHDFPNYYDYKTNIITWYGKPDTHSDQPLMKNLISGNLKPHFFARWNRNPEFTYLGTGNIINFKNGVSIQNRPTIEFKILVSDFEYIVNNSIQTQSTTEPESIVNNSIQTQSATEPENITCSNPNDSSFVMERHLEDFIVSNWSSTTFGNEYHIHDNGNGRQFQTSTGPLDILAKKNDNSEFLVIELKRNLASDNIIGQTYRYMGCVKNEVANENQRVRGCIVASHADNRLRNALRPISDIDFYEYKINFTMNLVEIS